MEGPRHGSRMRQALINHGYQITSAIDTADLVIAHSGGHLLIPSIVHSQRYLIIDASYRTNHTLLGNVLRHIWFDLCHTLLKHPGFYLWKTGWNIVYFFVHYRQSRTMRKRIDSIHYRPSRFTDAVITQSNDREWYNPEVIAPNRIHFIDTTHDDCWLHPETYLQLILR